MYMLVFNNNMTNCQCFIYKKMYVSYIRLLHMYTNTLLYGQLHYTTLTLSYSLIEIPTMNIKTSVLLLVKICLVLFHFIQHFFSFIRFVFTTHLSIHVFCSQKIFLSYECINICMYRCVNLCMCISC